MFSLWDDIRGILGPGACAWALVGGFPSLRALISLRDLPHELIQLLREALGLRGGRGCLARRVVVVSMSRNSSMYLYPLRLIAPKVIGFGPCSP